MFETTGASLDGHDGWRWIAVNLNLLGNRLVLIRRRRAKSTGFATVVSALVPKHACTILDESHKGAVRDKIDEDRYSVG
jgi:hypothetical protein